MYTHKCYIYYKSIILQESEDKSLKTKKSCLNMAAYDIYIHTHIQ
jgi:hypothetical protein